MTGRSSPLRNRALDAVIRRLADIPAEVWWTFLVPLLDLNALIYLQWMCRGLRGILQDPQTVRNWMAACGYVRPSRVSGPDQASFFFLIVNPSLF